MFGLGKPRSKFGKWVDQNLGSQKKLTEVCGIDRNTASHLCNPDQHKPNRSTQGRVIMELRKKGFNVREEDFWR